MMTTKDDTATHQYCIPLLPPPTTISTPGSSCPLCSLNFPLGNHSSINIGTLILTTHLTSLLGLDILSGNKPTDIFHVSIFSYNNGIKHKNFSIRLGSRVLLLVGL